MRSKFYYNIYNYIMKNGVDSEVKDVLQSLSRDDLMDIHEALVSHLVLRKNMTTKFAGLIMDYMKALTRDQVGVFWKLLNKHCKELSEKWYKNYDLKNQKLVFNSLMCAPGTYSHEAKVRSLDYVMSSC